MRVNYSIGKAGTNRGNSYIGKVDTLILPGEESTYTSKDIRTAITAKHPGWMINGYTCIQEGKNMRPKETKGKRKIHLVNPTLVTEVAKVREFGVEKYGDEKGWRLTPDIDYLDAAARHVLAAIEAVQQEDFDSLYDSESGLSHFAHAACDLMFIIQRMDEMIKCKYTNEEYLAEFKGDHLDDCTTL